MLTRLTIISHYIQIPNHYVVYLKLVSVNCASITKSNYKINTCSMILCVCIYVCECIHACKGDETDAHLLGMVTFGEGRKWGRTGFLGG